MSTNYDSMVLERSRVLDLSDDAIVRESEMDRYRASGPGGQKRNKTESAVRIRHKSSGQVGLANESRSQHENRKMAIRDLRRNLAMKWRFQIPDMDEYKMPRNLALAVKSGLTKPTQRELQGGQYLRIVAELLDLFVAVECSAKDTAERMGVSTARLSRFLFADDRLGKRVNELRSIWGLRPLS